MRRYTAAMSAQCSRLCQSALRLGHSFRQNGAVDLICQPKLHPDGVIHLQAEASHHVHNISGTDRNHKLFFLSATLFCSGMPLCAESFTFIFSLKQIIKCNLTMDYATVFSPLNSICRDHSSL